MCKLNSYQWIADKEFLLREYVVGQKAARQIAEEQDCSHATVLAYLEKYDIPIREYAPEVQRRGQIPYGYRLINGQLFPFIREQKVIHEMVSMRQQGDSLGEITRWLNNSGIKTKKPESKMGPPYRVQNLEQNEQREMNAKLSGTGLIRRMGVAA